MWPQSFYTGRGVSAAFGVTFDGSVVLQVLDLPLPLIHTDTTSSAVGRSVFNHFLCAMF
jgi:hypothetical protein